MSVADDVILTLRSWHRMPSAQLLGRLGVSRPTLMRATQALGAQLVTRGRARRTAYAARRAIRGSFDTLPLYRIDANGQVEEVAVLHPTYPQGCAADFLEPPEWPLDLDMADGWFDGLPYMLDDMRPQGFLGRHFASAIAPVLQVPENPEHWSEDDALHVLCVVGSDQPGCYIIGEPALRTWLAQSQSPLAALTNRQVATAYPALADAAMGRGNPGSSAGGEFPKFTTLRDFNGTTSHVIVKFSGSDKSPGARRWADLIVCEHLASQVVREHLDMASAESRIVQAGGRTFLEVRRFDRHGARGRSPVCSWSALNAALFGLAGKPWTAGAAALRASEYIDEATQAQIQRLWHFGKLIGNTDMHDGNLSFMPGPPGLAALELAPVYDMLPMLYAPDRALELAERPFDPSLPLPAERTAWRSALPAARAFWSAAATDSRISASFRKICALNAKHLTQLASENKTAT
ncbi:MAG: type II toxin-antitoxin system HipA family toxin YjjJ [Ramlibacter sp.]|nr:type II toxin-antitoxin system HipA family toxin YjjJ [Ramlibacter sp.]